MCLARAVCHTIYGYGRTVYNCKPYKKLGLPVQLQVTAISVLDGSIMGDTSCIVSEIIINIRDLTLQFVDYIYY